MSMETCATPATKEVLREATGTPGTSSPTQRAPLNCRTTYAIYVHNVTTATLTLAAIGLLLSNI